MSEHKQKDHPTSFADEVKVIYWKRATSGSEQLVLLTKAQQEREKSKKEIAQFDCANLLLTSFSYIC